jgi:uncharacterized protein (DUF1501 family)
MTCTRRTFLQLSGLAAVPALAPRLVFANGGKAASNADVVVVVFARGGMDGLNAIVPHGDADYYRLRPTVGIARPGSASGAALNLDGFFGLHPSMAALMPLYEAGRFAAVHATGFLLGSRSHFDCQDFMERAALGTANVSSGWLNRHLQTVGVTETFQGIGVGQALQLSLRGEAPAIGLSTIAGFTIRTTSTRKPEIETTFTKLYDAPTLLGNTANSAVDAVDALAAANPTQYVPANGATYPAGGFGSQMKEIAQLIKADLGLQVAAVDIGGWDHHADIDNDLPPLLSQLADGLAAFDTDLGASMANVTVVVMTEFGRRAQENASRGTDHGSAYAMMLLGGGVNGHQVFRQWPGLRDADLFRGDLAITIDYRTVLSELILKRMGGGDLPFVFPGFTQQPYIGAFAQR